MGWSKLSNGDLIQKAEKAQFELLITTDQNLRYQQNLGQRKIAIIVLMGTSWPKIQTKLVAIASALEAVTPRDYLEIKI